MPHGDPDPVTHLEPDQLRADRTRPLPPAPLGHRIVVLLWILRIAVVLLSLMVIFVFIHDLA